MRKYALLSISVLLIVASISMSGADSKKPTSEFPKYSTKVKLDISGDGETKNQVYSYFSRELRSLGDVQIVKKNPAWVIQVVAIERKTITGQPVEHILSVVILKPVTSQSILKIYKAYKNVLNEKFTESENKVLEKLTELFATNYCLLLADVRGHWLRCSGGQQDLQSQCQELVAKFDTEHLSPARQTFQGTMEYLKEYLKEEKTK